MINKIIKHSKNLPLHLLETELIYRVKKTKLNNSIQNKKNIQAKIHVTYEFHKSIEPSLD